MQHEHTILAVLLTSGLFGGIVNFLNGEAASRRAVDFFRNVCVAIAASMLVPLFLHTISSDLVEETSRSPDGYFVLLGFCLAAALCSNRFISSMTSKLLDEIRVKTDSVAQEVDTVKASVQPIIEKAEDSDPTDDQMSGEDSQEIREKLSELDKRVLRAMDDSPYTFRSPGGITEQLKLAPNSREAIRHRLKLLKEMGLVSDMKGLPVTSARPRWYISAKGRAILRSFDIGDVDHRA